MIYVFGTYVLDTDRRELHLAGTPVQLEPKVFELLTYLIQHHGYFVSRDALYTHLWPQQFVSEAALTYCVAEARKAVGDTGRAQRIIKTVYGRGYRFIAPVEQRQPDSVPAQAEHLLPTTAIPPAADQISPVPSPPPADTMAHAWTAPAMPRAERRQLTVLWCQWVAVSPRSSGLDPEEWHHVLQEVHGTYEQSIQHFDGWLAQHFGDGFVVYFGYPQAHEDNARRAVQTALAMVESTLLLSPQLRRRNGVEFAIQVGIHTGMVVIGASASGDRRRQSALGETPHRAAQLATLAAPNTAVVSPTTWPLIAGYFLGRALQVPHPDKAAPSVLMYQVLQESAAQSRLDVARAAGLTAFVGREHERGLLRERWAQSRDGWGQVVLLSGESGIGKSRLVQIFQEDIAREPSTRLEGRCSPYAQQSPLYPVAELVQRWLQWRGHETPEEKLRTLAEALAACGVVVEEAVPIFATLCAVPLAAPYTPLALDPQQHKQQTFATMLAWLCKEAEQQPVCLLLEDLHWVDPSTLEFLHLLIAQIPLVRLLLIVTCRPEFPLPWAVRSHVTHLVLGRLTSLQSEQMIERVAGGKAFPAEIQEQVLAKTNGVPLFVEELTKVVLESGLVKEKEQQYELAEPLRPLAIPTTLQDSLMARLDGQGVGKAIAQLGATLGREFSYDVLRAVSPVDEDTLQRGLAQLVHAEILYQRGLPPQAQYVFKHALIQDVAYQSLLWSVRQEYHGHIAQALKERFPEICVSQPELVAYHYTEAGLRATAVGYWQSAGQRALERSAYVEAIAHLQQGLTLIDALPDTPERLQQEFTLSATLGLALMATHGYATSDVERVYIRARECAQQAQDPAQLFTALRGLWLVYLTRCELPAAYEQGEQLLRLAQRHPAPTLLSEAHRVVGTSLFFLGEFATAWTHMEQSMAHYEASQHRTTLVRWTAWLLWFLGYPEQALERIREASTLASQCQHPFCLAYARTFAVLLHQCRREPQAASAQVEAGLALARKYELHFFVAFNTVLQGGVFVQCGQGEKGILQIREGIATYRTIGAELVLTSFLNLLAEAYGRNGHADIGLEVLDEALVLVQTTGERFYEAELYRLRGELLLQSGVRRPGAENPHAQDAEACFLHALSIARHQHAKSWELRIAISVSRLWQQQGKQHQARHLLREIYAWFTEGFETGDLQEARQLLEELQ